MNRKSLLSATLALVIAVCSALTVHAQQPTVAIDADDIAGVVTGPKGPEAGVWVIAETTDLPTRYIKSVVTDDQGRYVIPDLPPANYKVSVRGYGLVDSAKVRTIVSLLTMVDGRVVYADKPFPTLADDTAGGSR
jgi:hypothetical protein